MSETVGVAQLRQNVSAYLRRVENGERFIVTDRNRPVAELAPVAGYESRLDQLIAEGRATPPTRRARRLPPLEIPGDNPNALSEMIIQMRDEERS